MVHLPSLENYQELLPTPNLVRLTNAIGEKSDELTLLVKTISLQVRYILQGSKIQILFFTTKDGTLCYGFQIWDDNAAPICFWAAVNSAAELELFQRLRKEGEVVIQLFNEAAIN